MKAKFNVKIDIQGTSEDVIYALNDIIFEFEQSVKEDDDIRWASVKEDYFTVEINEQ